MSSKTYTLDRTDRKILNLLQRNNQMSTKDIAEAVHISQPTCLRRIKEFRDLGIISADVSIVDPFDLGYGMIAFVEVALEKESEEHMQEFEARVQKEVEVLQCYIVSGEISFFLIVHVTDMDAYYQFVRRVISGWNNVRHYRSRFPMKRIKYGTRIELDEKENILQVRPKQK